MPLLALALPLPLPLLLLMSSIGSAGQWRRSFVRVVRINLAAAIIKLQIAVVVAFVVAVVAIVVVAWHLLLLLSPFVCLVSPRLVSSRLDRRSQLNWFVWRRRVSTRTSHSIARTCPPLPTPPTTRFPPLKTRLCPLLGLIYLCACLSSRILMCFSLSICCCFNCPKCHRGSKLST